MKKECGMKEVEVTIEKETMKGGRQSARDPSVYYFPI
jgi:hypothetical protein